MKYLSHQMRYRTMIMGLNLTNKMLKNPKTMRNMFEPSQSMSW